MKRLWIALLAVSAYGAEVRLPPFTKSTLSNGVVVYMLPKPSVPLVSFRILVRGGIESEPRDMAGLSGITAQLLRRGTAKRTADQFSAELDSLGGTFGAGANEQALTVSGEFLRKDFAAGLDLTSDALLHAAFPEDETRKTLARSIDSAKAEKDNPQAAIGQYFRAFFYGPDHPYGRPADEASFGRINRAAIADYAHRMIVGRNLIVIVGGDFDSAQAASLIKSTFESVPAGMAYQWAAPAKPLPGGRLLLVDKPDATQTYFRIAQPGVSRTRTAPRCNWSTPCSADASPPC
jgi:predicted Zn-dependent peptidase